MSTVTDKSGIDQERLIEAYGGHMLGEVASKEYKQEQRDRNHALTQMLEKINS